MKEREVKSRYETLIIQIKKIFKQCIRKRHTSEKVWLFECQKCTRTYEKETRVKEHILLNHNVNLGGKEKDQIRKRYGRKNSLKCTYCPKSFLNTRYIVPHLIALHGEKSIEKKKKEKKAKNYDKPTLIKPQKITKKSNNAGFQMKKLSSLYPSKESQDHQENFDIKVELLTDDYHSDSVSEPDSEGQYMPFSSDLQSYLNKIVEDEYEHLS